MVPTEPRKSKTIPATRNIASYTVFIPCSSLVLPRHSFFACQRPQRDAEPAWPTNNPDGGDGFICARPVSTEELVAWTVSLCERSIDGGKRDRKAGRFAVQRVPVYPESTKASTGRHFPAASSVSQCGTRNFASTHSNALHSQQRA